MMKGLFMQSVHIAKTRSQQVKPKVVAFTSKVKCKKYPKAVRNSITREQLHEQQGIKLAMKQTSSDARIAALKAKLKITSQPQEGDVKKKEGGLPKNQSGGERGGIL